MSLGYKEKEEIDLQKEKVHFHLSTGMQNGPKTYQVLDRSRSSKLSTFFLNLFKEFSPLME